MQQVQIPAVAEGETYLGGRIGKCGDIEHSVVVAVNNERMSLQQQHEWAAGLGAVLMNRYEALVIYNEHRSLVEEAGYWTGDEVEWDSGCAWCQGFNSGSQYYYRKSIKLRAVAVRRFKN